MRSQPPQPPAALCRDVLAPLSGFPCSLSGSYFRPTKTLERLEANVHAVAAFFRSMPLNRRAFLYSGGPPLHTADRRFRSLNRRASRGWHSSPLSPKTRRDPDRAKSETRRWWSQTRGACSRAAASALARPALESARAEDGAELPRVRLCHPAGRPPVQAAPRACATALAVASTSARRAPRARVQLP